MRWRGLLVPIVLLVAVTAAAEPPDAADLEAKVERLRTDDAEAHAAAVDALVDLGLDALREIRLRLGVEDITGPARDGLQEVVARLEGHRLVDFLGLVDDRRFRWRRSLVFPRGGEPDPLEDPELPDPTAPVDQLLEVERVTDTTFRLHVLPGEGEEIDPERPLPVLLWETRGGRLRITTPTPDGEAVMELFRYPCAEGDSWTVPLPGGREQTFTVEGTETLETPLGTIEGCVRIRCDEGEDDPPLARWWFGPGYGIVRSTAGREVRQVLELVEVTEPERE